MPAATGRSSTKTRAAFRPAPPTTSRSITAGSGVFRWSAASSTLNGNLTYITNSLIPAGASAKLLVTPVYDSNNVYDNYPIGTWWSGSNWTIFNQKASIAASAPMPANATFNVVSVSGSGVFTQVASGSNSAGDYTVISGNSATDGRPNAVLVCSPRWDTSTSVYDNHNIGVYYTGGHWAISIRTSPVYRTTPPSTVPPTAADRHSTARAAHTEGRAPCPPLFLFAHETSLSPCLSAW